MRMESFTGAGPHFNVLVIVGIYIFALHGFIFILKIMMLELNLTLQS